MIRLAQDAEGLKVGVADLITQWVKGPTDGGQQPPCKPTVSQIRSDCRGEVDPVCLKIKNRFAINRVSNIGPINAV